MRRISFVHFLIIIGFTFIIACKPSKKEASKYLQNFTLLEEQIISTEMKLSTQLNKFNKDSAQIFSSKIKQQLDSAIQYCHKINDFHGDAGLKTAYLKYFTNYSEIEKNYYDKILELISKPEENYSMDDNNLFRSLQNVSAEKINVQIDSLNMVKEAFVSRYINN